MANTQGNMTFKVSAMATYTSPNSQPPRRARRARHHREHSETSSSDAPLMVQSNNDSATLSPGNGDGLPPRAHPELGAIRRTSDAAINGRTWWADSKVHQVRHRPSPTHLRLGHHGSRRASSGEQGNAHAWHGVFGFPEQCAITCGFQQSISISNKVLPELRRWAAALPLDELTSPTTTFTAADRISDSTTSDLYVGLHFDGKLEQTWLGSPTVHPFLAVEHFQDGTYFILCRA